MEMEMFSFGLGLLVGMLPPWIMMLKCVWIEKKSKLYGRLKKQGYISAFEELGEVFKDKGGVKKLK